jgi:hypothetical protein
MMTERELRSTIKDQDDKIEFLHRRQRELIEALHEAAEALDDYSDGEYIDGRPVGNKAMRTMYEIKNLLHSMGEDV